jgi:hypothetical protein
MRRRHYIIERHERFHFHFAAIICHAYALAEPVSLRLLRFSLPLFSLPFSFRFAMMIYFRQLPAAFDARFSCRCCHFMLSPPALFATIADADAISPFHASFHAILR